MQVVKNEEEEKEQEGGRSEEERTRGGDTANAWVIPRVRAEPVGAGRSRRSRSSRLRTGGK